VRECRAPRLHSANDFRNPFSHRERFSQFPPAITHTSHTRVRHTHSYRHRHTHTDTHTKCRLLCSESTHRSSARARRISASLSAVTPPISPARRNCRIIRIGDGKTVVMMDDGVPPPATELLSPPPPLAARIQTDIWFQKQKRLGAHLSPVRSRSLLVLPQKGVASGPVLLIPKARTIK
jgi:hypothetical protein